MRQLKRSQIQNGVIRFEPTETAHSSAAEVDIPITAAIQSVAAAISKEWKVVCPFVAHTRGGAHSRAICWTGLAQPPERSNTAGARRN